MSEVPLGRPGSVPPSMPPPGPPVQDSRSDSRPRWGPADALPPIIFFGGLQLMGFLVENPEVDDTTTSAGDVAEAATWVIIILLLIQQMLQVAWPLVVSAWKGLGIGSDWGFRFKPIDLVYGVGLWLAVFVTASVAGEIMARIVGLEDTDEASNTQILTDNEGSWWVLGVVFCVVIGAPLVEELLFRGLILRAFEKSFGPAVGIAISTVIFTVLHVVPGATWDETFVLWASIGMVGLVLAIGVVKIGRLGPAIIAHVLFNGIATAVTLLG